MNHRQSLLIYYVGKLIPAFASLFIIYFGLRALGTAEFGKYNLMMSSATIVSTLCIGWIQQAMLRFNVDSSNKKSFHTFTSYASFIGLLLMFLVGMIYFKISVSYAFLLALFTFSFCLFSVRLTQLQSQFRSLQYVIVEGIYYSATIVIALLLFFLLKLTGSSLLFISMFIAGVGVILKFHLKDVSFSHRNKEFLSKAFQYGFPITIWLFVSGIFNFADRYIIKEYYGFTETGIYSSVYDLIYKVSGFLCLPIVLTYHPAITKAWNENKTSDARMFIRKAILFEFGILIAMVVGFLVFGELVFNKVLKLQQPGLIYLTIPLVASSMLWQIALFAHKPLELLFKQKRMLAALLFSLGLNVVCNIILIPKFGYVAAAYTTLASTIFYIIFVLIFGNIKSA